MPDAPQTPAAETGTKPSASAPGWGAPLISIFSLALLLVALVFAYITKNDNLLVLLAGVIATNATTVVGFYVGSSASGQAKDATISGQLPGPPPHHPVAPRQP